MGELVPSQRDPPLAVAPRSIRDFLSADTQRRIQLATAAAAGTRIKDLLGPALKMDLPKYAGTSIGLTAGAMASAHTKDFLSAAVQGGSNRFIAIAAASPRIDLYDDDVAADLRLCLADALADALAEDATTIEGQLRPAEETSALLHLVASLRERWTALPFEDRLMAAACVGLFVSLVVGWVGLQDPEVMDVISTAISAGWTVAVPLLLLRRPER